ncbi:disulfide bond formation protein B [Alcaligenes sp. SDU_A2]|uniref:disulfide bond formation protein B n=1 Tax=Alcaligenes sp. SDU_A2 TaxID=3136634 RepID=UPI002CD29F18|nr:disulfide bond formation protein B [Alcaligenes sp.]HRL27902.1 disulfide bond formation protein B [Alcaligenes sp.]
MTATPIRYALPYYLISALAFMAVGAALLSQHVFGMPPCAWCVLQRLLYLILGVTSLCAGLLRHNGHKSASRLAALLALASVAGGILAAWYQYTVAQHLFSCDQTFADRFMIQSGLESALPWLFGIYATCMDARVDLLGMEYALWSLGLFSVLGLGLLAALLRRH